MRIPAKRMVTIKIVRHLLNKISVRHIPYVLVLVLLLSSPSLHSQVKQVKKTAKKYIALDTADIDVRERVLSTGKYIDHFRGHVKFTQDVTTMWCDSAHFSQDKNQLTAFSRVHIEQGDTLNIFSDSLFYD